MATITKSIGTNSRDYSTITSWESQLDEPTIYNAGDDAVGECYNDSAFNEAATVTINGGQVTPLNSRKLTVAAGQRHNGTAGTGARWVVGGARSIDVTQPLSTTVEWLEINKNGNTGGAIGISGNATDTYIFANLIVHNLTRPNGFDDVAVNHVNAIGGVVNCIVYDIESTGNNGNHIRGISVGTTGTRTTRICNNTVYGVLKTTGTGNASGIRLASNSANFVLKNNIAMGTGSGTSGTIRDFEIAGTACDDATNLSSDATADDGGGSGNLINKTASNQFISTVGGSENLHLKTGADAIDTGTDLVTTPTGVNIDIDGRDRDAQNDVWDMGADEFVAAAAPPTIANPVTKSSYLSGTNISPEPSRYFETGSDYL